MSDGYINIEMLLDSEGFKTALRNAVNEAQNAGTKTSNALASAKKGFSMATKGAFVAAGAFTAMYAATSKLVNIYHEKEAAEKRHIAVLKSMGRYTKEAVSQNIAYARSLQKISNYSDSDALNVMNIFHTFSNVDNNLAQKATKVALDMNSALGGTGDSARSTAIQVGKALQDKALATGLRRVGINIDMSAVAKMTLEQYQQYVLKELQSEFGGASEASVNPVKQMKNEIEDSLVEMGNKLTPVFALLSKNLLSWIEGITSVVSWFTELFSSATNITYVTKELAVATETYNQEMSKVADNNKLISRYEELSAKARLSATETAELERITKQLARTFPASAEAAGQFGEKLKINADRAKQFNQTLEQAAKIELEAKFAKGISEADKVIKNFEKLKSKYDSGFSSAQIAGQNSFGARNFGMGSMFGMSNEEQAKIAKENIKLQKTGLDQLIASYLKMNISNAEYDEKLKSIYERLRHVKLSGEEWAATLDKIRQKQKEQGLLFQNLMKNMPIFAKLTASQREVVAKVYKDVADKQGRTTQAWKNAWKEAETLAKKIYKPATAAASKPEDVLGKLNKLTDELKMKLLTLGQSEVKIKVAENTQKMLDQFDRLTSEDKKIIVTAVLKDGAAGLAKLQEVLSQRYGGGQYSEAIITKAMAAYEAVAKMTAKELDTFAKKYETVLNKFTKSQFTYLDKIKKVSEEWKKADEALKKWYETKITQINLKYSSQTEAVENTQGGGDELTAYAQIADLERRKDEETKKANSEFATKKSSVNVGGMIGMIQAIGDTISQSFVDLTDGFMNLYTAFSGGTTGQKIQAIGGAFKHIPIVGSWISQSIGQVGKMVDFFSNAHEDWATNFQQMYEAMKATVDYQIYQQNAVLRIMKQQQQVANYIEKLYTNAGTATKKSIEELQVSLTKLQDYSIGGQTLGGMSDDEKLATYKAKQEQKAHVEDLQEQASMLYSRLVVEINDASIDYKHGGHAITAEGVGAFGEWQGVLAELGVATYGIYDVLDKYGTPISDMQENMSIFSEQVKLSTGLLDADLEALEGIEDIEAQILELQQQETAELENQINLNNELSDSLKERLRALNNQSVNGLLDKLSDLEYKMSVGMIDENTGDIMRKNYMSALSNILSGLGEDTLNKEVLVTRADLMKTINNPLYDSLAGKGEIVEFHTGGQVTQSGLAALQAGEYVLRADQLGSLTSLSDNIGLLANANTANNTVINTPVNIYVDSVKSDDDIANIQKAVYTALDDIQNRTGAKALRFN